VSLLPFKTITLDSPSKRAAAFAAGIIALIFTFFVLRWTLGNAASTRAQYPEVAQISSDLAPDDPQTHYAAGVLLEKQFDIGSLGLAVKEYEKAAALSPNNYLYWIALGSARERSGDYEGAEKSFTKALELAPNYARVHWALGNALVRQGRTDEGFAEIRNAVASDPELAGLAASTAWNLLRGDTDEIRRALGESETLTASLTMLLVNAKRIDEALAVWASVSAEKKQGTLSETATVLEQKLFEARRFRDAAKVRNERIPEAVRIEHVSNGGFEDAVKSQNTEAFDWTIAPGQQPLIAPTSGQKHSGTASLVLIFASTESRDFRNVSQLVAVEPGREYELEVFCRADLKTKAAFKWEVVDPTDNSLIASTQTTAPSADWTRLFARFRVPERIDGILIRLGRVNCDGPVCQIAGNLWFDDIALKRVE
jgi:Flp pilus assembly protein TadD